MAQNDDAVANLTEAQREALRLVMAGYKSKEIAHTLGIGVDAVNKRLASAKAALGAPSRFTAARQLAAYEARNPPSHSLVGQFLAVEGEARSLDYGYQSTAEDFTNDQPASDNQLAEIQHPYGLSAEPLQPALQPAEQPPSSAAQQVGSGFDASQLLANPVRVFLLTFVLGALAALLLRL